MGSTPGMSQVEVGLESQACSYQSVDLMGLSR